MVETDFVQGSPNVHRAPNFCTDASRRDRGLAMGGPGEDRAAAEPAAQPQTFMQSWPSRAAPAHVARTKSKTNGAPAWSTFTAHMQDPSAGLKKDLQELAKGSPGSPGAGGSRRPGPCN